MQTATFGAGCFWGVEHILREVKGVVDTEVGYMGGDMDAPAYEDVMTGATGYAEVVHIQFDEERIAYGGLLGYFWRLHDPTQADRQGVDVGTQYRSVIFYHNDVQRHTAEKSKKAFDASGVFDAPSMTQIVPASTFHPTEDYHQDYSKKNTGYVCHVLREK